MDMMGGAIEPYLFSICKKPFDEVSI